MTPVLSQAEEVARQQFGFEQLRPGQGEAIEAVLGGRDTLAVLPTGAGKSAIYQVAGTLLDGPTLVVSPLIALQRDQVANIARVGSVEAAEANSSMSAADRRAALDGLTSGEIDVLFLAPEQLRRDDVMGALCGAGISLVVVDEAHCISGWGHDFRPDYLQLGGVIDRLGHPTVLALTATAAPPVRAEIIDRLGLRDPAVVVRGFDRPNIHFSVETFQEDRHKRAAVIERCSRTPGPGLVYVATRKGAQNLAGELAEAGLRARAYHAGLPAKERSAVHEQFIGDELDVVVATTAFGMGIDKPNVRYVFHLDISESVDAYYQEVGRAGRDGRPAWAVLFHRNEDLGLRRYFVSGGELGFDHLLAVAVAITKRSGAVAVGDIAEETGLSQTRLTAALTRLEEAGAVEAAGDGKVQAAAEVHPIDAAEWATEAEQARSKVEKSRVEMIRGYVESRACRREYLLNYFGEQVGGPCGNCDNCDAGAHVDDDIGVVPFASDSRVRHREWGDGLLVRADGDAITVLFDEVGYKTMSLRVLIDNDLLEAAPAK